MRSASSWHTMRSIAQIQPKAASADAVFTAQANAKAAVLRTCEPAALGLPPFGPAPSLAALAGSRRRLTVDLTESGHRHFGSETTAY